MANLIENYLVKADLDNLFVGELGWDNPPDHRKLLVQLPDNQNFEILPVAYKRGMYIYVCNSMPSKYSMEAIDLEISKRSLERLVVYVGLEQQIWRWPEPRSTSSSCAAYTPSSSTATGISCTSTPDMLRHGRCRA